MIKKFVTSTLLLHCLSYLGSSAEYGASYLLDEDVILVTVNYRLGPLGKYKIIINSKFYINESIIQI